MGAYLTDYAAVGVILLAGVLLAAGHETYNVKGLANGWDHSASREMTGFGVRIVDLLRVTRRASPKCQRNLCGGVSVGERAALGEVRAPGLSPDRLPGRSIVR